MISVEQVIEVFDSIGDECIHQIALLERLKSKFNCTEEELINAINDCIKSGEFTQNLQGDICKSL